MKRLFAPARLQMLAGIVASAALTALFARGGTAWILGFVLLAPWLLALHRTRTLGGALLSGWLMSVAYSLAAFGWFGIAFGKYTQAGAVAGIAVLALAAPLFQPQVLVFALVRHIAARRLAMPVCALAAAAAWVATEWLVPRLLGDTLGYGLYPSPLLRHAAEIGGTAGLTFMLLLANQFVAVTFSRPGAGRNEVARPLVLATLVPALLACYGLGTAAGDPAPAGKPLRVGLVQANIADYEARRNEQGAYAVVREVLDAHFAMSYDAVVHQRAEALLWTETVYPTTFGKPKSEAGARLDAEIYAMVNAAGVPLVFGTYDRDAAGEYNAAAFVQPGSGLLGFYRKTHLFPFTEYVPAWLDGPLLRAALPWAGRWQAGNGARVFPLRLADGREIPVLPLVCRDDVDAALAIEGARQGAQAILTMSNDSWFSADPQGARLHQQAAAFRSIETRLPQFRVTTSGYSAAIDVDGNVLAASGLAQPALVVADLRVRRPAPTLMVRWGDWVGKAACVFLLLLCAWRLLGLQARPAGNAPLAAPPRTVLPMRVAVLPPAARAAAGLMRAIARGSLLWMCLLLVLDEPLRTNTLAQARMFVGLVLLPEAVAWCILLAFGARATIWNGKLVLTRGTQRMELALVELRGIEPWRLPIPGPGAAVHLATGGRWRYGLACAAPWSLAAAIAAHGGPAMPAHAPAALDVYAQASQALRRWKLDHPLAKFVVLPLLLAIPAFHLHQHIAFGSPFGEYYSFGLRAYLAAFGLWWAAWTIGVVLCAATLRTVIEAASLLVAALDPARSVGTRRGLERFGRVALYLGLPTWLLLNIYGV